MTQRPLLNVFHPQAHHLGPAKAAADQELQDGPGALADLRRGRGRSERHDGRSRAPGHEGRRSSACSSGGENSSGSRISDQLPFPSLPQARH